MVNRVLEKTVTETPLDATHWSLRTMAKAVGIRRRAFRRSGRRMASPGDDGKLSNDPRFAEKIEDVVGLYLNPPEHAIVLSVDEKSQIQALDRTQPGAHEEGSGRNHDPRLQAPRHHHACSRRVIDVLPCMHKPENNREVGSLST